MKKATLILMLLAGLTVAGLQPAGAALFQQNFTLEITANNGGLYEPGVGDIFSGFFIWDDATLAGGVADIVNAAISGVPGTVFDDTFSDLNLDFLAPSTVEFDGGGSIVDFSIFWYDYANDYGGDILYGLIPDQFVGYQILDPTGSPVVDEQIFGSVALVPVPAAVWLLGSGLLGLLGLKKRFNRG